MLCFSAGGDIAWLGGVLHSKAQNHIHLRATRNTAVKSKLGHSQLRTLFLFSLLFVALFA